MRTAAILLSLSAALVLASATEAHPAKTTHLAGGSYENALIATTALKYVGQWGGDACADAHRSGETAQTAPGTYPTYPDGYSASSPPKPGTKINPANGGDGQCRSFVNCIVWMASGKTQWIGLDPTNYFAAFTSPSGGGAPGVEITNVADLKEGDIVQEGKTGDDPSLHTFIVVRPLGGSSFDVVDSNYNLDEFVSEHAITVTLGSHEHAFRMGAISTIQHGSLDPTFGNAGIVTTPLGNSSQVTALAVQPNGKLVAAGRSFHTPTGPSVMKVARYNQDGSLDNSFGAGGVVTTALGADTAPSAVAIEPDGKIVVAGTRSKTARGLIGAGFLIRYEANGSLDPTFGDHGVALTTAIGKNSKAFGIAVQPGGKLIVAGDGGASPEFSDTHAALLRFNANGSLDKSFASNGVAAVEIGGLSGFNSVIGQPDGRIVAAGFGGDASGSDLAVLRFDANGSLDRTFGHDGKVTTAIGNLSFASAIVRQPDGKLVVAGFGSSGKGTGAAVARYNANGTLDSSFGHHGVVTTLIGGETDTYALVLQSGGKLVIAGNTEPTDLRTSAFVLIRYNPTGTLDPSFGTGGVTTIQVGSEAGAQALVQQQDGKLVAAGSGTSTRPDEAMFALIRVNP